MNGYKIGWIRGPTLKPNFRRANWF